MVGGGGDKIITHGGSISSSNDNNNNKKLYKGVRLRKWGKWVSEIRLPNSRERIWLGSHDSAEKAARAFDAALYCLRGHNATFNFPDTPFKLMMELEQPHITNITHHHQSHQLLTTQEIQEIAAKFANHYSSSSSQQQPSSNNKTGEEDHQEKSSNEHDQVQVDNGGDGDTMMMNSIDWTFLNVLGSDHVDNQQTRFNVAAAGASSSSSDNNYFGLYSSDLEKMHSGEFLYTTTPPPFYDDHHHEIIEAEDHFSNQSFLWNWNF